MTREEIKNKVVGIVADKIGFPVSEIKESTRFKADLGTDSLDDIELLMEFERVFGIKIPDEEMTGVVTVGDVINGLAARFGVVAEDKIKEEEWSNEDERMLKAIIGGLGCIQKAGCERFGGEEMSDVILWIKNRFKFLCPQPKQDWSEEDERMLEPIISDLRELCNCETDEELISDYEDRIAWLESLRPQPHWKPSEEQMEALSDACVEISTFKKGKILESLYNDLEKLQK